jgi:hypothetical protein
VRDALKKHIPSYRDYAKIAVLNVGEVRRIHVPMAGNLGVDHDPIGDWQCHSVVRGIVGPFELAFAEVLANLAAKRVWLAT